jgi:hypothetical protein
VEWSTKPPWSLKQKAKSRTEHCKQTTNSPQIDTNQDPKNAISKLIIILETQ